MPVVLLTLSSGLLLFAVIDSYILFVPKRFFSENATFAEIAGFFAESFWDKGTGMRLAQEIGRCKTASCVSTLFANVNDRHTFFKLNQPENPDTIPIGSSDPETHFVRVPSFKFEEHLYDWLLQRYWSKISATAAHNALVIDLRGNTGGDLELALAMASPFVDAGKQYIAPKASTLVRNWFLSNNRMIVFSQTGVRNRIGTRKLDIPGSTKLNPREIVVLIDSFTGSAAEHFVHALRLLSGKIIVVAGNTSSYGVLNTDWVSQRQFYIQGLNYVASVAGARYEGLPKQIKPDLPLAEAMRRYRLRFLSNP